MHETWEFEVLEKRLHFSHMKRWAAVVQVHGAATDCRREVAVHARERGGEALQPAAIRVVLVREVDPPVEEGVVQLLEETEEALEAGDPNHEEEEAEHARQRLRRRKSRQRAPSFDCAGRVSKERASKQGCGGCVGSAALTSLVPKAERSWSPCECALERKRPRYSAISSSLRLTRAPVKREV